jgi:phytoene dehydrogenase-like protein
MKVLVVEQHDKPGGYCTSFKRLGFTFDAAAHVLGGYRDGGNFRKIIVELGIDKMVNISRVNPSDIVITPDFKINFWNDTKKTIDDLSNIFPNETDAIRNYFDYYSNLKGGSEFESVKLKDKTFASFLKSYFKDDTLISAISYPVFGYGGLPPSLMQAFTGAKIYNEFIIDGGYYSQGGMQKIPDALDQIIKINNGDILYESLVVEILTKNNEITGIKLDSGESYISKYVVSACDITQTFKTLLQENMVNKQFVNKLETMIPSISTFILYIAFDAAFKQLPPRGTNIWYLPSYDLDMIFNNINRDKFDDFNGGFVFRVSPDNKTILAFFITSYKTAQFWKQNKKKLAENFLNEIEKRIPGLKKHIVYFDAATPYTLYRYTLNYKGANYGWAPLQSQLFDPDFNQRTFLKGLYITGHWTTRAHGIPGVAYLGYSTAKHILKREHINLTVLS